MKLKKTIASLLSTAMLLSMLVTVFPVTSAASESDLRHAVANHAKMLAETEWMSKGRIARLNHPAEKTEAMHKAGVRPPTYFEYHRTRVAYRGVIMENTSASFEQFRGQLQEDGTLLTTPNATYYGMNQDAFLVDVVSRVSPTPITGVKQAITSEALVPLLDGINTAAATSKAAVEGATAEQVFNAYGKLKVGDLLITWDEGAKLTEEPTLSVLVVTGLEDYNVGKITVTYPAHEQPTYSFLCSKCGVVSTEGPTSAIITEHVKGANGTFSHFTTHKEVDRSTNCNGTWSSLGASTWHTSEVSFDQLYGKDGAQVTGGGICYLPYTLAVYGEGKAPEAEVKVTTDATAATVVAGFEAHIDSNYRIVQVDAVLSQPGSPDKVFTNYPGWTDWSYDYQNDALDLALAESDSGQYTLTLNVHTGPKTDPDRQTSPVVKAYTLDMALKEPALALKASAAVVYQGEPVHISVETMEEGIDRAELVMEYDPEYFDVDLQASQQANPKATFVCKGEGQLSVSYNGAAVSKGGNLVQAVFRAKRTGAVSVDAKSIDPFAVGEAWIAKGSSAEMEPTRVGGEQLRVGLGLNAVVYADYAAGKSLLLVPLLETPAKVTYDGKALTDVSPADYRFDGEAFTTVYGIVGEEFELSKLDITPIDSTAASVRPGLLYYNGDINDCGVVDVRDLKAIADIINGKLPLEGNMVSWLRADVDRSGKVDKNDMVLLMQQIKG